MLFRSSAIAALGAGILFAVAKRGRVINTGKVLRGAPWQIVIFSLGMYLVVYGCLLYTSLTKATIDVKAARVKRSFLNMLGGSKGEPVRRICQIKAMPLSAARV